MASFHVARFDELDARTLYELLRLRSDVFVVEQACPYPELDGRDTEPGTRHCWLTDAAAIVACLRLLAEPDGATRVGRVATARHARHRGYATQLLRHALDVATRPVVLHAQTPLVAWYQRLGLHLDGEELVEDGIPHVPMRLP